MENNFLKKLYTFIKELSVENTRLTIIDNYTWKLYKFISPYQIKYLPSFTYKFIGRGRLPSIKNKIEETIDPCDDFVFRDFKQISKNDRKKNVNIILKGVSKHDIKLINKKLPTFIVNMNYKEKFDEFDKVYQITCDGGILNGWIGNKNTRFGYKKSFNNIIYIMANVLSKKSFKKSSNSKILDQFYSKYKIENSEIDKKRLHVAAIDHKVNIEKHPMGSGIWAIIFILKHYNKLYIYGWDQYRSTPFKKVSIEEFIIETWNIIDLVRSNDGKMKEGGTFTNPKKFFCSLLLSYIYSFRILTSKVNQDRVFVRGKVGNINIVESVISKLKKIIYK